MPGGAAPAAVHAQAYRRGGARHLSVVVKVSLRAGPRGFAGATVAEPITLKDLTDKNRPMSHVISPSDWAPEKPRVDVTLLGHAHTPGGVPLRHASVRFALKQSGTVVFDRSIQVVGSRKGPNDEPEPFQRMPLIYERAHGGSGTPANPIGCATEEGEMANLLDPTNVWRPAGFGPIADAWPSRARRRGTLSRRDLDLPEPQFPADFDWGYFQHAPPEQQLEMLAADAVLGFGGLHPSAPLFELALPGLDAKACVFGVAGAFSDAPTEVLLRADTLHIDADKWTAVLVYRGQIPIADGVALQKLVVAAAIGTTRAPAVLPGERPAAIAKIAAPTPPSSYPTGTLDMSDRQAPGKAALPFGGAPEPTLAFSPPDLSGTLALPGETPFAYRGDAPAWLGTLAAPPAPAAPPPPELLAAPAPEVVVEPPREDEELTIERYATVTAHLEDPNADRGDVLEAHHLHPGALKKAEKHWKKELEQELRNGRRVLRDMFDDAYVAAWEEGHPGTFGAPELARVIQGEKAGTLAVVLRDLGLTPTLGMRLRRVLGRRARSDEAFGQAVAEASARLGRR